MKKQLLLILCAGLLMSSESTQATATAKAAGVAVGSTLLIAGTYAGLSSLYQLSERGHKFGWFVKAYHQIGAVAGLTTTLLGITAFIVGMTAK